MSMPDDDRVTIGEANLMRAIKLAPEADRLSDWLRDRP
jgi:hypothetical protein